MAAVERPRVYKYTDYRVYLSDYYQYAKAHDYGFSLRVFARRAGVRSFNYLSLVIDGQRNLTRKTALNFARGCKLQGLQAVSEQELSEPIRVNISSSLLPNVWLDLVGSELRFTAPDENNESRRLSAYDLGSAPPSKTAEAEGLPAGAQGTFAAGQHVVVGSTDYAEQAVWFDLSGENTVHGSFPWRWLCR